MYNAEQWNPASGTWRTLAAEQATRQYHSTALLLPDGGCCPPGGGICGDCDTVGYLAKNAQVFTPPYLYKADGSGSSRRARRSPRRPAAVDLASNFQIDTPDAAAIRKVALVRLGAVTHSVNMEQRYIPLSFTAGAGSLTATSPANVNIAPPGVYMLFVIDADGVPSVATMMTVGSAAAPPPPPPPPKATFVQARQKRITSGTVNSLAFSSPNTAGNLSVVYVAWSNAGPVTISDTRGNTYAPVAPATAWGTTQGWRSQLFYAKNIAGGSNTVTARFGSAISGFGKLLIHEYSGLDRTAPLDASASNIGTAAAMDSGSAATTKADDLIFGAASSSSNVTAAGGGFTSRLNGNGSRTEDRNVTSVGSYNATATQSGTAWVMHAAAFKADSSGDSERTVGAVGSDCEGGVGHEDRSVMEPVDRQRGRGRLQDPPQRHADRNLEYADVRGQRPQRGHLLRLCGLRLRRRRQHLGPVEHRPRDHAGRDGAQRAHRPEGASGVLQSHRRVMEREHRQRRRDDLQAVPRRHADRYGSGRVVPGHGPDGGHDIQLHRAGRRPSGQRVGTVRGSRRHDAGSRLVAPVRFGHRARGRLRRLRQRDGVGGRRR